MVQYKKFFGGCMKKTLSRYGNSLALIIDKPILELLNIKDNTLLTITTDGTQLIITPEKEGKVNMAAGKDPRLQRIIEEAIEEYAEGLQRLADN